VRLLGGGPTLRDLLEALPENWEVVPEQGKPGDEAPLLAFLPSLDFYVALAHEDAVPAVELGVLRAMALGVPVVLPPALAERFGEAALYAEPGEVWSVVSSTWASPQDYAERVEAGLAYVRRHCDVQTFGARLEALSR